MGDIKNSIILILSVIAITLIITLIVVNNVKNKEIKRLQSTNDTLNSRVASAESMIKIQNTQIEAFRADTEYRKQTYEQEIQNIQNKYNQKIQDTSNMNCDEKLFILNRNQEEFLKWLQ